MKYPTAADLAAMGITLERDVCLCNPELSAWFGRPPAQPLRIQSERGEPKRIVVWPRKRAGKRIA